MFGIFAALAEFERELIREHTVAGLKAARARGRRGGRKFALTKAQVRLAQAAMAHRDTSVSALCRETTPEGARALARCMMARWFASQFLLSSACSLWGWSGVEGCMAARRTLDRGGRG